MTQGTVRDRLRALRHVIQNEDTTLDLWAFEPRTDGDPISFRDGRCLGGMWVEFLRKEEDPTGLQTHMTDAIIPALSAGCTMAEGFVHELARTVSVASVHGSASMASVSSVVFDHDRTVALNQLPWVRRSVSGIIPWAPVVTGDYFQDKATGRHYAALLIQIIRQHRWFNLLSAFIRVPEEHRAVRVGMCHTIGEMISAAPVDATRFVEAARLIGDEREGDCGFGGDGFPVILEVV